MVVLDLKTRPKKTDGKTIVDPHVEVDLPLPLSQPAKDFSTAILSSIQHKVFPGDSYLDLTQQLTKTQAKLSAIRHTDSLPEIAAEMDVILDGYRDRQAEANQQTAIDFRQILSLVNESVNCLSAGDQKSDERLQYLERSLTEARKIDSLPGLRRHLAGILDFVRTESKLDRVEKESRSKSMADRMQHVQAISSRLRASMPGKPEALEYMKRTAASLNNGYDCTVSLFVVESLKALRERHGEVVAVNLLDDLVCKQIQPLSPEGKVFCWSASGLILVSQPQKANISSGVLSSVPSSFEYRAFLGARVATFKLGLRSISASILGPIAEMTVAFDRFTNEKGM